MVLFQQSYRILHIVVIAVYIKAVYPSDTLVILTDLQSHAYVNVSLGQATCSGSSTKNCAPLFCYFIKHSIFPLRIGGLASKRCFGKCFEPTESYLCFVGNNLQFENGYLRKSQCVYQCLLRYDSSMFGYGMEHDSIHK